MNFTNDASTRLNLLRSQVDRLRDSELPRILQTRLTFDSRGHLDASNPANTPFRQLNANLTSAMSAVQQLSLPSNAPDLSETKDILLAEILSMLDAVDQKRLRESRTGPVQNRRPNPVASLFARRPTFTAPPRTSSASPAPTLDLPTTLALAASEMELLDSKLLSLSGRRLAFEISGDGSLLADPLPRIPPNEPFFSILDALGRLKKTLNGLEVTDRVLVQRKEDLLVNVTTLVSRLESEKRAQHARQEAERLAVEIESLDIREAQRVSREDEERRAQRERAAIQAREREASAAHEQAAKLEADRQRLEETRRRVEMVRGLEPPSFHSPVSRTPSSPPSLYPPHEQPAVHRSASDLTWSSEPYIPLSPAMVHETYPRSTSRPASASGVSPTSSIPPRDPYLAALEQRERELAEIVERERIAAEQRERELLQRENQLRALEAERMQLEAQRRERAERERRIAEMEAQRREQEERQRAMERMAAASRPGPPVPPREPVSVIAAVDPQADDRALLQSIERDLAADALKRPSLNPASLHALALSYIDHASSISLPTSRAHPLLTRAIDTLRDAGYKILSSLAQAQPPYFPTIIYLGDAYLAEHDVKSAIAMYNIGSERGHPVCCEKQARIWEEGKGVRRDTDKAKEIRGWKGMGSEEFRKGKKR